MVAEAREVRERMLRDLAEKRKLARQKIEWARAGRAKILETLRETSDAVDGLIGDLAESDRWVGQTADSAAAGVVDDVDLVVAELEATLMSEHAIAPVTDEPVDARRRRARRRRRRADDAPTSDDAEPRLRRCR